MELILSSISAGGMSGIADQYLCLLVVGLASRFKFIQLVGPMQFMSEWWFIVLVALLWILTLAPAYSSLFAPGVMNAINTVVRFVSGFLVPISSALLALAYAGIIVNLDPSLRHMFETIKIFNGDGGIGTGGILVAGGSAVVATTITGMKALAKPAVSASTQTTGHLSAPIYATIENVLAIVVTAAIYALGKVNPWLIVVLLVAVLLVTAGVLGFGVYQLWRLKRGIGRMLYLAQVHPRAGLAVAVEFFVWGLGWLVWKKWARGVIMLLIWITAIAVLIALQASIPVMFAFVAPLIPVMLLFSLSVAITIGIGVGLSSAGALLQTLEREVLSQAEPGTQLQQAPA